MGRMKAKRKGTENKGRKRNQREKGGGNKGLFEQE